MSRKVQDDKNDPHVEGMNGCIRKDIHPNPDTFPVDGAPLVRYIKRGKLVWAARLLRTCL